jgi:hypothetical protein
MAIITKRRIGVILLQAMLAVLIGVAVNGVGHIPFIFALPIVVVIAEIVELTMIFSNLKMRYWFPSLPIYLFIIGFSSVCFANLDIPTSVKFLMPLVLFSVTFQIIAMLVISAAEHVPKSKLMKHIYNASRQ